MSELNPFHLAFPVRDIEESRVFYRDVLGCETGRCDKGKWLDFNFFGHQVVAHCVTKEYLKVRNELALSHVDGQAVPVPHFGVVLDVDQFHALVQRITDNKIKFEIEPYLRFKGLPGEQWTCFFFDPSGNALEFKAFKDTKKSLFATSDEDTAPTEK